MSLQGLYTKVISTRREKLVDDGYGGSKRSWQDHLTGIKCRIVQSSGRWELTVSGKTVSRTHLMFCDPDVDITTTDRVIDSGEEYQVIFVKQCENSRALHHLEVSLEKI
jgi:head-tail adaptor